MPVQYVSRENASGQGVLELPDCDVEVVPGVNWGSTGDYFSPAFWAAFAWKLEGQYDPRPFGNSLREELAACMLCGYGIPSEIGLAAFARLRANGLLAGRPDAEAIQRSLGQPLDVNGRQVRYRFHRSKGLLLAAALLRFDSLTFTCDPAPVEIRSILMTLPGVGPKTASYVVRNYYRSDDVAVLDIHITRASRLLNIFPEGSDPQRNYFELERRFLAFAKAVGVRASVLDNLMWDGMRTLEPATRARAS